MILLWHEGALGDLLLSRLAVAALKEQAEHLVLCARHEARRLFLEAGLVDEALPTSLSLLERLAPAEKVYLFASQPALREVLRPRFGPRVCFVPTRPSSGRHLAWQALEAVGARSIPVRGLRLAPRGLAPAPKGPLLLHPGSGGRYKCAPLEFWQALYAFLKGLGQEPLFILGPAEADWAQTLGGFSWQVCTELDQALSLLRGARGFLGHDSGLTHLAAALGVPVWAVFGPTAWREWAPFGSPVTLHVRPCSCLAQRREPRACPRPCLSQLKLEEVRLSLLHWLAEAAL